MTAADALLWDVRRVLALALYGLLIIELVVTLPWPKEWLAQKPLNCIVCMSGWWVIARLAVAWHANEFEYELPRVIAAGGLLLLLLTWRRKMSDATMPLPPPVDGPPR